MTISGTSMSGATLPNATNAPAPSLAAIVDQLAVLVQRLQALVQQLQAGAPVAAAADGAATLAGGPSTGGCSCGSMQPMQGAAQLASPQPQHAASGGGAMGAPSPPSSRAQARQAAAPPTAASPASFADLPKKNPYSFDEMVAKVKREVDDPSRDWDHLCLGFAARAYGWNASGTETAIKQWQIMPAKYRHPGDSNPPPGALVFWDTGAGKAGHVAIYLGDGKIASNDIRRKGKIDIVPLEEISSKWGAKYLGWTAPYFENGV